MIKVFSVSDKRHPVTLQSGKWYTLAFIDDVSGKKLVAAPVSGNGMMLSTHLYFDTPTKRPSYIKVRFVRHRGSVLDVTANSTYTVPSTLSRMTIVHSTPMATQKGVPISVQVYIDRGTIKLTERIYKGYE